MQKTITSFREFKRTYFPRSTEREEVARLQENPKLYGRYLAIRTLSKTHQQAMEELYQETKQ